MLIAEELYLLLTKDTGTPERPGTQRGYGLSAALIADLVLAGRVALTEEKRPRVTVGTTTPTGDPVLDFGLDRLASHSGKRLDRLVTSSRLNPEEVVVASLVQKGVLSLGDRTMLGLGKPRTPEADSRPERELRGRLAAVLAGASAPTPADATLLSVLQALGVAPKILAAESGGMRARELKARIAAVVEHSPTGESVDRAIQAMNSAMMTAVIIPIVVSGGSSG
ncbi:GPP34 family phosphoprotein [Kocuria coralli]|uniref:GPP34 family phosphoprotein n=1 Tax=Kocuria coralli TaxID=1461025 RepID=A0A5J5KUR5_9MICC|nr:GPP34 family phosphoprotein [Kocuria coralli]KAA9393439.1 GPP34 family phosphoprotein [Kocuria coralli]